VRRYSFVVVAGCWAAGPTGMVDVLSCMPLLSPVWCHDCT
jgi:hypothetical protein